MLKAKLLTLCASTLFMGAKAQTPKLGVDPIEKVINAMTLDEKLNVLIGSGRCEQNVNSVVLQPNWFLVLPVSLMLFQD